MPLDGWPIEICVFPCDATVRYRDHVDAVAGDLLTADDVKPVSFEHRARELAETRVVVDDQDPMCHGEIVARNRGVCEAVDGSTALAAVAAIHPDVVLLDVQLPDANGFDIARSLGATADAPIVVMTSTRDIADYGARLAASGARGFIPKSRLSGRMLAELVSE